MCQQVRKGSTDTRRVLCGEFSRVINGCLTDAAYTLYFDAKGELLFYSYSSPKYDSSAVKPPHVTTEAEIEKAKREAVKFLADGRGVVKQEVSESKYQISTDRNYFNVKTFYRFENTWEQEDLKNYFQENGPIGVEVGTYEIVR